MDDKYYYKTQRYNVRAFWADYKTVLPLHYAVYLAEVGCKKAAAANVESVFSGAGRFTSEVSCLPVPAHLHTPRHADATSR